MMILATWDGAKFIPEAPVPLAPGPVRLGIVAVEVRADDGTTSFVEFGEWLKINGSPEAPT
jgi:hypothetical protein